MRLFSHEAHEAHEDHEGQIMRENVNNFFGEEFTWAAQEALNWLNKQTKE